LVCPSVRSSDVRLEMIDIAAEAELRIVARPAVGRRAQSAVTGSRVIHMSAARRCVARVADYHRNAICAPRVAQMTGGSTFKSGESAGALSLSVDWTRRAGQETCKHLMIETARTPQYNRCGTIRMPENHRLAATSTRPVQMSSAALTGISSCRRRTLAQYLAGTSANRRTICVL
jgi:hypothetical protein